MKTAIEILDKGAQHMRDRAKTYDNESGEHSIPAVVNAFRAVTGVEMTYEQGWIFMSLVKLVRSQQGEYKRDNYEDGAAYMALAGEQREALSQQQVLGVLKREQVSEVPKVEGASRGLTT